MEELTLKKLFHDDLTIFRANPTRNQLRRNREARRLYFSAVLVLALCAALTVPA